MPEANFAAMRFDPLVFTMTIVEDLGIEMSTEQYAEIITSATIANLLSVDESGSAADIAVLDERMIGDVQALQYAFEGEVDGRSANYVITAFVNGSMAYQITTFGSGVSADVVMQEANTIVDGFSFIGDAPALSGAVKQVDDYISTTFAYQMKASTRVWTPWTDFKEDYGRGYWRAGNRQLWRGYVSILLEWQASTRHCIARCVHGALR
jgi:hypothetical protein